MVLRVDSTILVARMRSDQQPIAILIKVAVIRGNSKHLGMIVYHRHPVIRIYEVLRVQELRRCFPRSRTT